VVHVEARTDLAVAQEIRGLGGEKSQEALDVVEPSNVGQLEQIARERRRDVVREPPLPAPAGRPRPRLWVPTLAHDLRERGATDRRPGHLGRAPGEELVDDVDLTTVDLALGERPHVDAVDAAREGVLDPSGLEHVRRAGDHETSWRRVLVHGLLEREQQVGDPMDLVDERRPREIGHESGRVAHRGFPRRLIVQREGGHRMLVGRDVVDERGLSDLSCAADEDDPEVLESFDDERADTAGDQAEFARHGRVMADAQSANLTSANGYYSTRTWSMRHA
jgi:hypothetical protein